MQVRILSSPPVQKMETNKFLTEIAVPILETLEKESKITIKNLNTLSKIKENLDALEFLYDEKNNDELTSNARKNWRIFLVKRLLNEVKSVFNKYKLIPEEYDKVLDVDIFRWVTFLFWIDFISKKEYMFLLDKQIKENKQNAPIAQW